MENIQQREKYLSWAFFFPHCGLSIKAAVIMPLKYNSDTHHLVKFVLLKMEKTF